MAGNFGQVYGRLSKIIKANFDKSDKIVGIVENINTEEKYFTIRSLDNTKTMECFAEEQLSNLQPGCKVTIKGFLRLYPESINRLYFAVESMYLQTEEEQYNNAIDTYNKLHRSLYSEKYKPQVEKLKDIKPPALIRNIGLVVMPNSEEILENFKATFQQQCTGKLYIYHLKEGNIENSLHQMLEYFKKYHQIDLICILSIGLTTKYVCQLSSRKNVISMLHRKGTPFVVSVVNSGKDKAMSEPLTAVLSSNKFDSVMDFVDYVHAKQTLLKDRLKEGIQTGKDLLFQALEQKRRKLADIKMSIASWDNISTTTEPQRMKFDILKEMLSKSIYQEKLNLRQMQLGVLNNILSDVRFTKLLFKVIDGEKIARREREALAGKNLGSDALTERLVAEKMEQDTKKIENKTADSLTNDVLSIKIQHQNGDL